MQMQARVLAGSVREFRTKAGKQLPKSSVKVLDMGPECGSDVTTYWVDFLGDAALTTDELESIVGTEVTVGIRSCRSSLGNNGKVFQNISGAAILDHSGRVVQAGLAHSQKKAS
jgi:hypothetical protein